MSLKQLQRISAEAPKGVSWDTPSEAVAKWDASLAFSRADDATITIYDAIGSDGWSEGVTAKRISAALRSIGNRDVTVSINSPGGDFFEGIAIYNLLMEHPYRVTVKVVGLAASAASVIAMAGDEIQVAKTGFLMIHNSWAVVIGNRHDLEGASKVLQGFDAAMAGLYAGVAGITVEQAAKLMDDETWMSGESAITSGFATALLDGDEISASKEHNGADAASRKIDKLLAMQGLPRSERRELLKQIKGTPCAARVVTPCADLIPGIEALIETLRDLK